MKTCLECITLDLKQYPNHSKVGFGHCQNQATGSFYSFSRPVCEKFKQAPDEIVEKRIEFDKRNN